VIRIAALVARLWPRVAAYLGLLTLGREGEAYRRPIFLMAICLAFGVFFASLAASAEVWLVDRWQHAVGADLVLKLDVGYGDLGAPEDATAVTGAAWLPISDYEAIEGVTHAARVAAYTAKVSGGVREAGRGVAGFRLLGVDPADFGRVAYFRQDYASFSLGDLLNRLTARPDGLLLPAELAERLCLGLGDRVVLDVQVTGDVVQPVPFALVGTFDHFPTMVDALTRVAVVNLSYLETETGGPRLYDVWLRLAPAADTESILSGVRRLGVKPLPLSDLRDHLRREEGRLERAGLYGMLSVCFLAGALFAGLGLLVHSYAALTGQSLRFAVWQAMGLHRAELMAAVSVEYLLVLGYGMASGLGVGLAAALIYVPLYRLIEGEGPPVPPFLPVVDWRGAGILAALMALYLAGIEVLIVTRLARTKVFEALRMGEKA